LAADPVTRSPQRWSLVVSRSSWSLVLLVCAAMSLRIVLALRPGVWGDEIFSLAMATGHSLEHPAADARPDLGDFVEPPAITPSASFRRYAEHEDPPAGSRRVVRAVLLSDTNPPLYYLLLNAWTRLTGTGDQALRFFSLLWATLTLPLLWVLGRDLGDRAVGWTAVMLYAWSPVGVFYSIEGRMYSMLWCLATALAWLSLRQSRGGVTPARAAAWIVVAVAGLYTHYFFAFVGLACGLWMVLWPGRASRLAALGLGAITTIAVAPWYGQVPSALARWRITGTWLNDPLHWPQQATRPFELAWSLLAGGSHWGGSPTVDAGLAALYVLLALWLIRGGRLRSLFLPDRRLVWLWVAVAVLGPWVFDLVRHTGASRLPRYVLGALPAAMLLVAFAVQPLPGRLRAAFVGLVLLGWTAGLAPMVRQPSRPGAVYGALASELERGVRPEGVVLVHSVPSGVIGLSRALSHEMPFLVWIEPLGLRRTDELPALLQSRRQVALVQVHNVGLASPAERWLQEHGRLADRRIYDGVTDALTLELDSLPPGLRAALLAHQLVEISYFEPIDGAGFTSARR
jgi:Dolichyl-phosphate-mannose-protein mannosyltransferase